ncbi:MAG: hypothetical protein QXK76_00810 [Candidatus Woesearchaeota archaeon]
MNKRGSENTLFFLLWELLAFGMVLIIIIVTVRGVVNNNTFWKNYYARDIAMIIDIENINQGDFIINYKLKDFSENVLTKFYFIDDKIFEISLSENSVLVYDYPKEESKYPAVFPYAKNKNIKVINDSISETFITINKIGDKIFLNSYNIETTEVCPSFSTTKDFNMIKFNSIPINNKIKSYSDNLNALLKSSRFGSNPNSLNESTIFLDFQSNFTVYYSEDSLKSQKFACIFKMKFLEKYQYAPELKKYDGFLDNNIDFINFLSNKRFDEYWIAVALSDEETKINPNEITMLFDKTITEFYE